MSSKKETIQQIIHKDIVNGLIKPGQKLPSIRMQSQRFGCSLNTIISVYQELENQYLIYSRPKSGYFVVAEEALFPLLQTNRIDFATAAPDAATIPHTDFRQCLNKAMELFETSIYTYPDPQGLLSLRQEIVKLFQQQQVFPSAEQVFIFSGAQQALHILAGMPFPNGKINILVEQPTYWGMLAAIDTQRQTVIGIERTAEGLDWEALERHFQSNNIKFFYTIPRFHNPLGTSYTAQDKQRLAELAKANDVYIVEDDYLADLDTNSKADPIYAYNGASHVIYLRSFSKVMLPGLRIAAAAVPSSFIHLLQWHKHAADLSTSVLSQGVLEIYMKSGMYAHHAKQMKSMYDRRINHLKEVSQRYLPEECLFTTQSCGGVFASIQLPDSINIEDLVKRLDNRGVDVFTTDKMFIASFPKLNLLRLSIIRTDEQAIEEGIRIIAEEVENSRYTNNSPKSFFRL
ncbi:aminotransferase-like domain-containing protein [Paenibacillus endoradicis]|uniref:aminotransferase-like domain-containing protein n=1 Tax=Paenibacillus endoradicis TaxID=2972487 RepID=UPI0021590FCF|nr:PLP-dependent aminotransferase family protein [Paenibacillus endoradicis]MCR8655938.1 PLP-dependent aminotransferase family protein [Paenibacillus endoradicis]MCR8658264.1 PLP-dependent aminotransferase family protein [Paenibacillus endoradicis]